MYEFEWDDQKEQVNIRKHGLDFSEASTVFYDDNARIIGDPDHSVDEDRFIILGLSTSMKVLVVCHCYRESETIIRIFSARKATKSEEKGYWSFYEKRV